MTVPCRGAKRRNLPAPQASAWNDQLEPPKPIARTTSIWCNNKNFDFCARLAIEDVLWKPWHTIAANAGNKFNAIPLWVFADLDHRRFKRREVA